jgi:hypothetical protein
LLYTLLWIEYCSRLIRFSRFKSVRPLWSIYMVSLLLLDQIGPSGISKFLLYYQHIANANVNAQWHCVFYFVLFCFTVHQHNLFHMAPKQTGKMILTNSGVREPTYDVWYIVIFSSKSCFKWICKSKYKLLTRLEIFWVLHNWLYCSEATCIRHIYVIYSKWGKHLGSLIDFLLWSFIRCLWYFHAEKTLH